MFGPNKKQILLPSVPNRRLFKDSPNKYSLQIQKKYLTDYRSFVFHLYWIVGEINKTINNKNVLIIPPPVGASYISTQSVLKCEVKIEG